MPSDSTTATRRHKREGRRLLAAHDRAHALAMRGPPAAVAANIDTASVVVIDDQPANVALLQRIIRDAGIHDVHGVTDPRQAVERCLELNADIILLDLHMPHKDGFAIMSELRDRLPDDAYLPVLVLTADTTTETRNRALSAGANDFLTKPFDRVEVTLRVRNLGLRLTS